MEAAGTTLSRASGARAQEVTVSAKWAGSQGSVSGHGPSSSWVTVSAWPSREPKSCNITVNYIVLQYSILHYVNNVRTSHVFEEFMTVSAARDS